MQQSEVQTTSAQPLVNVNALTGKVRNFRQVNSWLFRCGQFALSDTPLLAQAGITTIVSLRWDKHAIAKEQQAAKNNNINFISIRMSYWSIVTHALVDQFFAILDAAENRPILVHCREGKDRTGLMIALYRVFRDQWTFEDAYKEMRNCGFHRVRVRHFKWILRAFAGQARANAN